MTPEKQRALAIECGAEDFDGYLLIVDNSLSTYTAAVEAKERERCVLKCKKIVDCYYDSNGSTACDYSEFIEGKKVGADECMDAILSNKEP